jgi:hypothetical protein
MRTGINSLQKHGGAFDVQWLVPIVTCEGPQFYVLIAGNHAISGVGITPLSRHKRGRQPALLYIKWRRQRTASNPSHDRPHIYEGKAWEARIPPRPPGRIPSPTLLALATNHKHLSRSASDGS